MKISIPRQDLMEIVNKVKSVVASKSALPILSHVLMQASGGTMRLAATDLKVSVECEVDCEVLEEGALTVSSQRLASILAELPDENISLELTGNNVIELKCGRIETKLFSMAPDEFPPIRTFDQIEPTILSQKVLKDLFLKTSFAICTDQARYNLTGLLFEISRGKLAVVSTDGRRMSLALENEGIPERTEAKVIIPAKMIHELERLLVGEGDVQVFIDESQAAFVFDHVRLVSALIEGNFPNYEMVIPQKHDKEIVINTAAFTESMRRTRTMTNDKFNSVRFHVASGAITLKVVTPEVGEYEEDLPVDYTGDKVDIAFNPDFILDVLKHINAEKVCLMLKDNTSPGIIKPYTEAPLDTYLNVVMPIRI